MGIVFEYIGVVLFEYFWVDGGGDDIVDFFVVWLDVM